MALKAKIFVIFPLAMQLVTTNAAPAGPLGSSFTSGSTSALTNTPSNCPSPSKTIQSSLSNYYQASSTTGSARPALNASAHLSANGNKPFIGKTLIFSSPKFQTLHHASMSNSQQGSTTNTPALTPAEQAAEIEDEEIVHDQEREQQLESETPTSDVIPTDVTEARGQRFSKAFLLKVREDLEQPTVIGESAAQSPPWILVTAMCHPLYYGIDDAVLFAAAGSVFSACAHRTLTLRQGHLFVMTADQIIIVATRYGNIQIPAQSADIIEQNEQGFVRVANISGGPATMSVGQGDTSLAISPAEEILISNRPMKDEELKADNSLNGYQITQRPVIGSDLFAIKQSFDRKLVTKSDPLLNCKLSVNWNNARTQMSRLKRDVFGHGTTTSHASGNRRYPITSKSADIYPVASTPINSQALRPISYSHNNTYIANSDNGLHTVVSDTATIRLNESSSAQIETSGIISLAKGEALISASKQTIVKSGNYTITMAAGSIALVVANDDAVMVTNLWSSSNGDLNAYIGNKLIAVPAGQEIIIGNNMDQVTKILKSDNLARREVRIFELAKSDAVAKSEVSLVSVINNTRILSRMLASSESSDRALIGKLKKMAACLNQTTANHGPYSVIGKP